MCAALDAAAVGGVGTNPEYAVNSTDRFLTSLSRIQIEIKDEGKVSVLKFWVWPGPCARCRHGQTLLSGAWLAAGCEAAKGEERGKRIGATLDSHRR